MENCRILFLLIFVTSSISFGTPEFIVKPFKIDCEVNSKWISNYSCNLKAINRDITESSFLYYLSKTVEHPFVAIKLLRRYNGFQPFLINIYEDLCSITSNNNIASYYFKAYYRLVSKYLEIKSLCPISDYIFIKNYRVKAGVIFKNFMPHGIYRTDITLYDGSPQDRVLYVSYYFEAKENNNRKNTSILNVY